jgi:hypothetical protein
MLLALPALVACATPCQQLADRVCQKHGEGASACVTARGQAREAGPRDQQACTLALQALGAGEKPPAP